MSFLHDRNTIVNTDPLVYAREDGNPIPAPLIDPFGTYYCKSHSGEEWAIRTGENGKWRAMFDGGSVSFGSFGTCIAFIRLGTKDKTCVRVTCDTGKTWKTQINAPFQTARLYFLGMTVTDEGPETGTETNHIITSVEEI